MSAAGIDSRRAWGIAGAAFAAMFAAFGIAYSYGAFLEELRADFGAGRALASVFFSLTSLLYFGLGSLSGAAADRYGPRPVLLTGAAAFGIGLVVTANAGSLAVALVAYGLGVGIGVACAYVPMVALVSGWFELRRTLALGVAVAGIGLGTLIVPPATAALIEAAGWRDAYLVLGAGGAARAVLWELREAGARTTLFARDAARAATTAQQFDAAPAPLDGAHFDGFDLVVNATPLGTRGRMEDATPAAAPQLRGARIAYDLVYNPRETRFLREAREAGCSTLGGLPMLVAQAAAQFKLWTAQDAPLDAMREAAEKQLSAVSSQ
jgi:MFS family permease